jgi:hypothetical protein
MSKKKKTGYSGSLVEAKQILLDYHLRACKVPPEFEMMIKEIVNAHLQSLSLALGNLELCYLRTKQHYKK